MKSFQKFFYAILVILSHYYCEGRLEATKIVSGGVYRLESQHDGAVSGTGRMKSIKKLTFYLSCELF